MAEPAYGDLVRVSTGASDEAEPLRRVPLRANEAGGGAVEKKLQGVLFRYPQILPIEAIDASYAEAVPICRELRLPAGKADALYVNRLGRITLAEFKLWRNPEARREVIGQILDYAKDLASWSYWDLQDQVARATGKSGNVVYDLVCEREPDLNEAEFVDNVTRHLKRGEFLLLIVGDGIRESAAQIVEFVQEHSGLHFNLALVEAALYRDAGERLIVQPRVLARTEVLQRLVVEGDRVEGGAVAGADPQGSATSGGEDNLRFWRAVLHDAFSQPDINIEPDPPDQPTLSLLLPAFGEGKGWALYFNAYLGRKGRHLECFLTVRKNKESAGQFFNQVLESLPEIRSDDGVDLQHWRWKDQQRIGFSRKGSSQFSEQEESEAFDEAVAWMREHLDILVSTLHPRLQRLLASER